MRRILRAVKRRQPRPALAFAATKARWWTFPRIPIQPTRRVLTISSPNRRARKPRTPPGQFANCSWDPPYVLRHETVGRGLRLATPRAFPSQMRLRWRTIKCLRSTDPDGSQPPLSGQRLYRSPTSAGLGLGDSEPRTRFWPEAAMTAIGRERTSLMVTLDLKRTA